jgi:hypothetical protein
VAGTGALAAIRRLKIEYVDELVAIGNLFS